MAGGAAAAAAAREAGASRRHPEPEAAEIARGCCIAEARSAALDPCSAGCADALRAGDCLEARSACRARGGSAMGLTCDDAFAVCLGARGTSREKWDRCVGECSDRRVAAACR